MTKRDKAKPIKLFAFLLIFFLLFSLANVAAQAADPTTTTDPATTTTTTEDTTETPPPDTTKKTTGKPGIISRSWDCLIGKTGHSITECFSLGWDNTKQGGLTALGFKSEFGFSVIPIWIYLTIFGGIAFLVMAQAGVKGDWKGSIKMIFILVPIGIVSLFVIEAASAEKGTILWNFTVGLVAAFFIFISSAIAKSYDRFKLNSITRKNYKKRISKGWFGLLTSTIFLPLSLAVIYPVINLIPLLNRALQILTLTIFLESIFLEALWLAIIIGIIPHIISKIIQHRTEQKVALVTAEIEAGERITRAHYRGAMYRR